MREQQALAEAELEHEKRGAFMEREYLAGLAEERRVKEEQLAVGAEELAYSANELRNEKQRNLRLSKRNEYLENELKNRFSETNLATSAGRDGLRDMNFVSKDVQRKTDGQDPVISSLQMEISNLQERLDQARKVRDEA